MTGGAPVHSITMSGASFVSAVRSPEWYVPPSSFTSAGLGPLSLRS